MKLSERQHWWLNKFLPGFLFISFCSFVIFWAIRREYHLSNDVKYTIGITQSIYRLANQTKHVKYTYKVEGKEYEGSDDYRDSTDVYFTPEANKRYKGITTKVPSGRYYVKFSTKDPDISEIYQDKPVPDSIKAAPPEGWEKLPE